MIENITFNETLKAKEDWLFWLEIFEKNPETTFINENLALYRINKNSISHDANLMKENTKKALLYIYNSLNDTNKEKLFTRLIFELEDSKDKVRNSDERRVEFLHGHFKNVMIEPYCYDLVLNSSRLGEDCTIQTIIQATRIKYGF